MVSLQPFDSSGFWGSLVCGLFDSLRWEIIIRYEEPDQDVDQKPDQDVVGEVFKRSRLSFGGQGYRAHSEKLRKGSDTLTLTVRPLRAEFGPSRTPFSDK